MTPSSDMPEKVSAERLREIVDGCEGVTPGPWFYRPQEHDDWGWVRATPPSDGGPGWLIATARRGRAEQPGEDDIHRSTQTDPYGENARHIARLDPATVRSIGLELIEARALIDTLQRERDERNEWAAMWHGVVETLATVHGLGILDYNEVIPAFGRYVDAIKAERHELRAEVTRLREALKRASDAMEAEAVVLDAAGLARSCAESLHRKAANANSALSKDTP